MNIDYFEYINLKENLKMCRQYIKYVERVYPEIDEEAEAFTDGEEIYIEKFNEINQTGSVEESCLIAIATYERPTQKIIGKI